MSNKEIKQHIKNANHGDRIKLMVEHRGKSTAIYGRVSVGNKTEDKYFVFETDYDGNGFIESGMVHHYALDTLNINAYETLLKVR